MLLTTELANSLAALISGAMARKHKGEDKNRMEDLGSQWKLVVLSDRLAIPDTAVGRELVSIRPGLLLSCDLTSCGLTSRGLMSPGLHESDAAMCMSCLTDVMGTSRWPTAMATR